MKIKNPKIFAGTFIAFMLIAGYGEYKHYKINRKKQEGNMIEKSIEELKTKEVFEKVEEINVQNLEKPTIKLGK